MSATREVQIERLRQMGRGGLLEYAGPVSFGAAAVCAVSAWYLDWVPLYIIGGFIGLVAIFSVTMLRALRNAIQGEREGVRVRGKVDITITDASDSPTYGGVTHDRGVAWKFEFLPLDWKPAAGQHAAELVYLRNVDWPVLVLLADGIIVPNYKPTRA